MRKTISIPIYTGNVTFIIGEDFKQLEEEYNLQSTSGMDAITFNAEKETLEVIVAFSGQQKQSTIAHELLHVCHSIMKHHHISPSLENDEPEAYLLGWLIDEYCEI